MIRLPKLLIALLFLAPLQALAWSDLGHRLVGELAQRHLTAAANAQVAGLLQGEAEPSLAGIASWADNLRKADPQAYPGSDRWHYVNFPAGTCAYEAPRDCPGGNCVTGQIERQRAILADRAQSLPARRDALKFLVHFVGDGHQPLHNSNRRDKGGNDYQISLRTPLVPSGVLASRYVDGVMGTNLHSIWDYYVLGSEGLAVDAYADRLARRAWPPKYMGKSSRPADWATESCKLIDAHRLYPKGHKLDHDYLDAQRPLAERQVLIAARRLASLLNTTLVE